MVGQSARIVTLRSKENYGEKTLHDVGISAFFPFFFDVMLVLSSGARQLRGFWVAKSCTDRLVVVSYANPP